MYLSSWAQKKSTENSSFHRAFFCAAEKSTIKSTILGAIGVPEPLCHSTDTEFPCNPVPFTASVSE